METINQFQYSRKSTIIGLTNIDENIWDEQPAGFPNTIRWNAGHIYATAEEFLNKADHNYEITYPDWFDYFIDGTRPSEWDENVPQASVILKALKEQDERIATYFKDKLPNKASERVDIHALSIDTADASVQFVTWHEGLHLGIIKALVNAIE